MCVLRVLHIVVERGGLLQLLMLPGLSCRLLLVQQHLGLLLWSSWCWHAVVVQRHGWH